MQPNSGRSKSPARATAFRIHKIFFVTIIQNNTRDNGTGLLAHLIYSEF